MDTILRPDHLAKLASIALIILAFVFWWPFGLAVMAYMIWSRRMRCCGIDVGRWHGFLDREYQMRQGQTPPHTSGNRAFDDYRSATLRRLEEEQGAFQAFLDRLRHARDKAEFDQFMNERGKQS